MYTKTIIITHDKRFEQFIKLLLRKKKREIESDLPLLTDLESIRNDIVRNKNTFNIRGEFEYFIKEYGLPYMMIIDYQTELSVPGITEPDNRKLLKTFILAFTILAEVKGYDSDTANLVLIIEKKHETTIQQFAKYPLFILDQIRSGDDRINAIIDAFASDREKVNNFFKIFYILQPADGNYAAEIERLEKIMLVCDKLIPRHEMKEPDGNVEMLTDDFEPADVICRATLEKIIVNGELKPITDEQKSLYIEKNIHIHGSVTQKTNLKVQERVLTTIMTMAKINPFKKDEKIFIHVPDTTLIDKSFASSMGSFLATVLDEYSGLSINIGKDNLAKVRKTPGFIALKDFIFKNL